MQIAIQGTVKELASHGLRVNGKPVTQQMLSVLIRLGACEEVGQEDREEGQKGPSARIYRFGGKKTFNFSIDNKPVEEKAVPEPSSEGLPTTGTPQTTPLEALKTAIEQEGAAKPLETQPTIVSVPALPPVLQNMSENDIQAMIVALQSIQSLMHSSTAKH